MNAPARAVVLRLAAESGADPRTAEKFLRGQVTRRGLLLERLTEAAKRLSVEVPRPADGETPRPEAKR